MPIKHYGRSPLWRASEIFMELQFSDGLLVEIRKADLADATSLTRELRGCDASFYLVHSMMSADREYARRDLDLALTFARSALDAGVRRIIYLGGLGETGFGLSEHLSSRRDVESALGSAEYRLQSSAQR